MAGYRGSAPLGMNSIPLHLVVSTGDLIEPLFITIAKIERGNMLVKVQSVQNRSADLINYTIPYILSFFGFDLSKWADIISLTIFLLIMMLLTIKSKSVFLNPILALRGYGLYDLEYQFNGQQYSVIALCREELGVKQK